MYSCDKQLLFAFVYHIYIYIIFMFYGSMDTEANNVPEKVNLNILSEKNKSKRFILSIEY